MGRKLALLPESTLERVARDSHMQESARRAARRELDRRSRLDSPCPRGAGCNDWDCERSHG